jgi:hypothetical protein
MLRCSHCGAEFSEWAARCPSCRKPADPVAIPSSGAPATELGGHAGAPPAPEVGPVPDARTEAPGPPRPEEVPSLPLPVGMPSAALMPTAPAGQPSADPAAGNGHSAPVPAGPSVIQLQDAPPQAEHSFQRRRQVPRSGRTATPMAPDPVEPEQPQLPPSSPQARDSKPGSKPPGSKPPGSKPPDSGPPDSRPRRGRRKASPALVIIGFAVVALVATMLVSRSRRPAARPTQVQGTQTQRPNPTAPAGEVSDLLGYTLVAADAGSDIAVVPFSGTRRTLAGFSAAGYPDVPVRTGGSVVVVRSGTAYALNPPFYDPPVRIGPADHVFPARTPGGIGVWKSGALPTLEFVPVPGTGATTASATVPIPRDLRPLAELPAGILVWNDQAPGGRLRVWRPSGQGGTGTFIRTIGLASAVVGWSGDKVAWLTAAGCTGNGECPLHVTDAATGTDALVPPPPGFAGYLPGGAFSPTSNQLLAVYVFNPVQQAPAARLVLVSLTAADGARPRWTPVLVPQGDVGLTPKGPRLGVVWTPDGAHVLFSGSSGRIHDYRPGRTASSATEQPASASFTVVGEARVASPSPTRP